MLDYVEVIGLKRPSMDAHLIGPHQLHPLPQGTIYVRDDWDVQIAATNATPLLPLVEL